jgi:hypothetical protein
MMPNIGRSQKPDEDGERTMIVIRSDGGRLVIDNGLSGGSQARFVSIHRDGKEKSEGD